MRRLLTERGYATLDKVLLEQEDVLHELCGHFGVSKIRTTIQVQKFSPTTPEAKLKLFH